MALFGSLDTIRWQLTRSEHFAAALNYVSRAGAPGSAEHEKLFSLAPGTTAKVDLEGGAFAILQAYVTKPRPEGKWETHVAYIDVQAIFQGEEFMEVADRAQLQVQEDLTKERDAVFYHPFSAASVLRCSPGTVAVYFPPDAHMGAVAVAAPMLVRKVVVKVPVPA